MNIVEDNVEILNVVFDIMDGDKVVEERKLGYPLEITQKDIKADLSKFLKSYLRDIEIGEATKRSEELNKNANEIKENLEGTEIKNV